MDDTAEFGSPFFAQLALESDQEAEIQPFSARILGESPFLSAFVGANSTLEGRDVQRRYDASRAEGEFAFDQKAELEHEREELEYQREELHHEREEIEHEREEAGVIRGDNRVRITNTTAIPWRWICRVDVKGNRDSQPRGGTGVLVSDRHVLTSAHVVYEAYANMQNFSIEVKPGLNYGDEPFGSYLVTKKPRLPRNYRRDAENSLDFDYALLTLEDPIGSKTFAKLKGAALCYWGSPSCGANSVFSRPDPSTLIGKSVFTAGYPRSAGAKKLMCAAGIIVGARPRDRIMRITADTTHGQSGSPVWIVQNGRCCLVGIAAGAGKHTNVVVRVTREFVRQIREWVAADGETPSMLESEEPLEAPGIDLGRELSSAEEAESDADNFELESASTDELEGPEGYEAQEHEEPDEFESEGQGEGNEFDHEGEGEGEGEGDDLEHEELVDDEMDEVDFEHLGILEHATPPAVSSPTLGFEFDMNYGFEFEVADAKGLSPPSGWSWPSEGLRATDHEWKDSTGAWKDAIQVSMDAVRMEISTAPFHIDDDSEFDKVVAGVTTFGQELVDATKKRETGLRVPGFSGHPTTFKHARTVVNKPEVDAHGTVTFPGDADHASYQLAEVPLVVHRVSGKYPTDTKLWASPQATITLPLDRFGSLVWEIHKTRNGKAGVAFTGRDSDRLGLRDDLAWTALKRAMEDRKKRLGTALSDGSSVSDADYTRSITCLVAILVMYMLTSVVKDEKGRDEKREAFAKGSLPLNVKTPFWEIHKFALTDRERFVFKELYGDKAKRVNLYSLAKRGATSSAGSTGLFPSYTRWDPERFFNSAPTWERLVEAVIDEKPMIVEKDNDLPKKKHKKGNEILIAPLSNKISWDKTKPRIAIEMRRIGFAPVHFEKWKNLMVSLRNLAKTVNK